MGTFKAYLKKEFMESSRQYKYIVVAAGLILFAILDPLMLKMLPNMLKGKLPPEMAALFVTTQKTAIQDYINNVYQIGSLFIIFSYCGTLCEEIHSQKLVFPYSKGSVPSSIVAAKFLHYSAAVVTFTILGFLINYYYVTTLFTKDAVSFSNLMTSAVLTSIYMLFNVALVTFFSSIVKKGLVAGVIVLAISYFTPVLMTLKAVKKFVPYNLIDSARNFTFDNTGLTIALAAALSVILLILSMIRMSKVEVI